MKTWLLYQALFLYSYTWPRQNLTSTTQPSQNLLQNFQVNPNPKFILHPICTEKFRLVFAQTLCAQETPLLVQR